MAHPTRTSKTDRAQRRSSLVLWGGMFVGGAIALAIAVTHSNNKGDEVIQPVTLVDQPTPASSARTPVGNEAPNTASSVPERLSVRVVHRHPHDPEAFTQGLLWDDGSLYESTGQYGESTLRIVELETGRVLDQRSLDASYFGEGLALVDDHLIQLTWRSGIALFWRLSDLELARRARYQGEGWGLCYDGSNLVMSNGSSTLAFRDPESFEVRRQVKVLRRGRPVLFLNELECVGGEVYANIWRSEEIVRIDATTGQVTAIIDASGLLRTKERWSAGVLNGIAYLPQSKRFLLTGKHWPYVFEVEFVPGP